MHSRHVMAVRRGHFTGSVELVRCDVRLCFSIPVLGTQGDCRQRSVGCDRHCQSGPFGFTAVGLARRKKNVQQRHQEVDQPHGGCSGNAQEGEGGGLWKLTMGGQQGTTIRRPPRSTGRVSLCELRGEAHHNATTGNGSIRLFESTTSGYHGPDDNMYIHTLTTEDRAPRTGAAPRSEHASI